MTPQRPVFDLSARRLSGETALRRSATAPVLHVTQAFLDALNCRGEWAADADDDAPRRHLRAV